jgi:5-methylcytosine-specific restriction endonuclease McrA
MTAISEKLRQLVSQRASGLCEYCQSARLIIVIVEVDHIVPRAAGGETNLDNLCLVCRGCNSFKGDFQTGRDPD